MRKQEGLQRRGRRETLVVETNVPTYEMISGETIEYELGKTGSAIALFFNRVLAAADDPAVSVVMLEELVYGLDNPLLSKDILPGRAVVTLATYDNPVFVVMLELIGRKRIAVGQLDVQAARLRHTMTVRDAALQLGVTEGAIRQAIYAGRISAWKDGGTHYLDPTVISAYRVSRRGPKAAQQPLGRALEVRCGSNNEAQFNVKTPRQLVSTRRSKGAVIGTADAWERVAVLAAKDDGARLFVLQPADEMNELEFEGFYVRGWFIVTRTENNARRAREAFKAFKPE